MYTAGLMKHTPYKGRGGDAASALPNIIYPPDQTRVFNSFTFKPFYYDRNTETPR